MAQKIRWDHKVLVELASGVDTQAALADAFSVAVGQQVSASTLNNHLYRNPESYQRHQKLKVKQFADEAIDKEKCL